uniref:Uncharacterized protein n=1 Tax=Zea mays TaxID=4577 RepID=A0A804MVP6_MAIZE
MRRVVRARASSLRALVTHRHRCAATHCSVLYRRGKGAPADALVLSSATNSRLKFTLRVTSCFSPTSALALALAPDSLPPAFSSPSRGRGGRLYSAPRCSNSTKGGCRGTKKDTRSCTGAGSTAAPREAWPQALTKQWKAAPSPTTCCTAVPTTKEPQANRVTWSSRTSPSTASSALGCRLMVAGVAGSGGTTLSSEQTSAAAAVASTSRAPAPLSRMARLPRASTPSRPAHSGYSASAAASPASRTELGGAGGWKKYKACTYRS